jgi:hypothetical protein
MMESENIYLLTPSRMNPHCDSYAKNEANMLDWEGHMVQRKDRVEILLQDIPEDTVMTASVQVSSMESNAIDSVFESTSVTHDEEAHPCWEPIPRVADEVLRALESVSPILDDQTLYGRLSATADMGRFKASIGSTNVSKSKYLIDDDLRNAPDTDDDKSATNDESGADLDQLYECATRGEIDLDSVFVSAAHAGRPKGVNPEHLSKIWKIDLKAAERTLEMTTQHSKRTDNPKLSRNYGTNDRMLRFKQIHEYFFMDTFFATKKAGKSSRGHTCCQLFVTDKGFVYVVPMKSKGEALQAVKQFAKEIGAPEALICDMSGEQTSHALKRFCNEIGTTLRVLEEGTPWANKAEL